MSETATTPEHKADAHGGHDDHHDHVVSANLLHGVFAALLVLTVVTVFAATVDMGRAINIVVAMAIAIVKASLVAVFFMHLKWDKPYNSVIFLVSLGFLALFLGMATLDTTQNQWRKSPEYAEAKMENARKNLLDDLKKTDPKATSLYHPKTDLVRPGAEGAGGAGGGEVGGGPESPAQVDPRAEKIARAANQLFGPLPRVAERKDGSKITEEQIALGRMLYYDTRLSVANDISCNSCHDLATNGADKIEKATSSGHKGQLGTRNSPTVFNAAAQKIGQFWDARARDVEEQATMPITNPVEMAMANNAAVEAKLRGVAGYAPLFKAAFPEAQGDPITMENVGKAIGAFERKLMTQSRWDRFLNGHRDALTSAELDGYEAFVKAQCTVCHMGPLLGGQQIEKLGKVVAYPTKDKGVAEETKMPRDEFMFKVPPLREITKTAPYLHDGSIKTLEEMIQIMAKHQVAGYPDGLPEAEVQKIVTFLKTLEGEVDPAYIAKPTLPE